jgi:hypothetical protein
VTGRTKEAAQGLAQDIVVVDHQNQGRGGVIVGG